MAVPTLETLENGGLDLVTNSEVSNNSPVQSPVISRLGERIKPLSRVMQDLAGVDNKGPWTTSTLYVVKDLVQESGTTYQCAVEHTSGTFATDNAAGKWAIYQTAFPEVHLSDYASLAAAIAAIGATFATLLIDTDDILGANLTIPNNVTIRRVATHTINGSTFTITNNSWIDASDAPLFLFTSGTMDGDLLNSEVFINWFGADRTGNFDSSRAIQIAGDLLFGRTTNPGGVLRASAGSYLISDTVTLRKGVTLKGYGHEVTVFKCDTATPFVWSEASLTNVNGGGIKDCKLKAVIAGITNLTVNNIWQFMCHNVHITGSGGAVDPAYCIKLRNFSFEADIRNCRITDYTAVGISMEADTVVHPNGTMVTGCDMAGESGSVGIKNEGAGDVKISNMHFEGAAGRGGIFIHGTDCVNNHIYANQFGENKSDEARAEVLFDGTCYGHTLNGNRFACPIGVPGIKIEGSCYGIGIVGNAFIANSGQCVIVDGSARDINITANSVTVDQSTEFFRLDFTSGGTYPIATGDIVEGETSGATASVWAVRLVSGTWAGGDAVGSLYVASQTGTFVSETLKVGLNLDVASISGDSGEYHLFDIVGRIGCVMNSNIVRIDSGRRLNGAAFALTNGSSNCLINDNNVIAVTAASPGTGVYLGAGVTACSVSANAVRRLSIGIDSAMTAGSKQAVIQGNVIAECATPIQIASLPSVYLDRNLGFVSQNKGVATILSGNTSIAVAHGLDITPDRGDIILTASEDPTNTPGLLYVGLVDPTSFEIKCENDPGASNLDVYWKADFL